LTLPVSTATTERAFSVMNIVRTSIRNRIENDFLASYLNKTKSCWFFLQVMYNKLKQILYLVILFLTTSNKIILAPPRGGCHAMTDPNTNTQASRAAISGSV
jgi:hypothetical protein